MAKRSGKSSGGNALVTIIVAVLIVLAGVIANLTGVDILAIVGLTTPQPTPFVIPTGAPGSVTPITLQQGFGGQKGFWSVYFTAPTGSRDASTYTGGIEVALIEAIEGAQRTIDIAAYEWNLERVTQAVIDAHERGVQVRMVTDDEAGIEDEDALTDELIDAGIQVVDDSRSALMHNKFIIIDSTTVWTGSWNYTVNDTYRNNNNAIALRSQRAVQNYQAEFDEMFGQGQFGPRSPANTPFPSFSQDGTPIQIYFSPEDKPLAALVAALNTAQTSVRFMTFSFTDFDVANALIGRHNAGASVEGIFETTGSETEFSELRTLRCAGIDARQDGNPFVLHHKVFIVDNATVITGSFNISTNAADSNDENLLIITDPDLAALYTAEYERRAAEARVPNLGCN